MHIFGRNNVLTHPTHPRLVTVTGLLSPVRPLNPQSNTSGSTRSRADSGGELTRISGACGRKVIQVQILSLRPTQFLLDSIAEPDDG